MAAIFQERNWFSDFKNLNELFRMKFLEIVEETWTHRVNRFRLKCRPNFSSIRMGGWMASVEMNSMRIERKVGGKRYEARNRGRSSPDTLAF